MSLPQWATNGWLRPHNTSKQEISDLFFIVDRDLTDAEGNISADRLLVLHIMLPLSSVLFFSMPLVIVLKNRFSIIAPSSLCPLFLAAIGKGMLTTLITAVKKEYR